MTAAKPLSRRAKRDLLITMSPDDLAGSFSDARLARAGRPTPADISATPARRRATTGQIVDRTAAVLAVAAAAAVPVAPGIALSVLALSVLGVCLGVIPQARRERAAFRREIAAEAASATEVRAPAVASSKMAANDGWAPASLPMAA